MGQMQGSSWHAIADKLVAQMALTKGERVFLLAMPGLSDSLIEPLRARIQQVGGVDLGAISVKGEAPPNWGTPWTNKAHGLSGVALEAHMKSADVGLMLPGAAPTDPAGTGPRRSSS